MEAYILDEQGNPVREPDTLKAARWCGCDANRRIALNRIANGQNEEITVSTVFLCFDHAWGSDREPILFETMIFGFEPSHELYEYQNRYSTREQAIRGHEEALLMVLEAIQQMRTTPQPHSAGK